LNRKQFAEQSGIPYPTVIGWTNLNRLPDYNALIKIADFFACSIDYLVGREDDFDTIHMQAQISAEEQMLLSNYQKLSTENKQIVEKLTEKLFLSEQIKK
jgi:transcriptional regulator with XRE-family HTH domain